MKVIGVAGYARCGKDTFVELARTILERNGYTTERLAFADKLKAQVQSMLDANQFPLDVQTKDTDAKTKLRPLLVWWGCTRRDLSKGGLYWVNVVDQQLQDMQRIATKQKKDLSRHVVFVSDVRFPNEANWIHNQWQGTVVHIKRWKWEQGRDGYGDSVDVKAFDAAPNAEEAQNDPIVEKLSDVKIEWESRNIPAGGSVHTDEYLNGVVLETLNSTKFFKHQTTGILS